MHEVLLNPIYINKTIFMVLFAIVLYYGFIYVLSKTTNYPSMHIFVRYKQKVMALFDKIAQVLVEQIQRSKQLKETVIDQMDQNTNDNKIKFLKLKEDLRYYSRDMELSEYTRDKIGKLLSKVEDIERNDLNTRKTIKKEVNDYTKEVEVYMSILVEALKDEQKHK